jgi:hypothetical protein
MPVCCNYLVLSSARCLSVRSSSVSLFVEGVSVVSILYVVYLGQ